MSTRQTIAKKSLDVATMTVVIVFADGHTIEVVAPSLSDEIQANLLLHGLSQKLGDSYAGAADLAEAVEKCETIAERLAGGEWVKPREGAGPRPSLVVNAVVAALEAAGQEVDDARRETIKARVAGKEGRERALDNPVIRAEYERMRAESAAARAAAAAAKAGDTTADLDEF